MNEKIKLAIISQLSKAESIDELKIIKADIDSLIANTEYNELYNKRIEKNNLK